MVTGAGRLSVEARVAQCKIRREVCTGDVGFVPIGQGRYSIMRSEWNNGGRKLVFKL